MNKKTKLTIIISIPVIVILGIVLSILINGYIVFVKEVEIDKDFFFKNENYLKEFKHSTITCIESVKDKKFIVSGMLEDYNDNIFVLNKKEKELLENNHIDFYVFSDSKHLYISKNRLEAFKYDKNKLKSYLNECTFSFYQKYLKKEYVLH